MKVNTVHQTRNKLSGTDSFGCEKKKKPDQDGGNFHQKPPYLRVESWKRDLKKKTVISFDKDTVVDIVFR